MSKGTIRTLLFIIVFLLIIAVILVWLTDGGRFRALVPEPAAVVEYTPETAAPQNIPQPIVTAKPAEPEFAASTPAVTPAPAPAATPTPTPAPTPTPTPAPTPASVPTGTPLGSGSFRSDTGTALNITAEWSARTAGSSTAEVEMTVKLNCYALNMIAVAKSLHLCVGEEYVSLDVPAVDYSGREAMTAVIGTHTFTVPLADGESKTLPVAVEWQFGGSYGKDEDGNPKKLDVIECGGSITLTR